VKKRITVIVQKIQQLGRINKPIPFQSPEKYPEIKRPPPIVHNSASRHEAVFAPQPENKELLHLPEQLSKLIFTTDNELKELLEIARVCLDAKGFTTITSNSDLVQGLGTAPSSASSLSDFVMYGGQKNPYIPDIKERMDSKAPADAQENQEKLKITRNNQDSSVSVLHRSNAKDSSRISLRPSKPPPKLLATSKVTFNGAVDFGDDQNNDDDLLVFAQSKSGMSKFTDSLTEDNDNMQKLDEKVHGDALDFISEKKPTFSKQATVTVPSSKPVPSQSTYAMPRMTSGLERSTSVQEPLNLPSVNTKSISAEPVPPPPVSVQPPPNIDVPLPPSNLNVSLPPAGLDVPVPPSGLDVPVPPPDFSVPVPPPDVNVPLPPPDISVPVPPVQLPPPISIPSAPKEAPAPKFEAPPADNDRCIFLVFDIEKAKFLESVRTKNPLARLKAVPKELVKDGSLTVSEKRAQQKNQAKAGMAKAQNVLFIIIIKKIEFDGCGERKI